MWHETKLHEGCCTIEETVGLKLCPEADLIMVKIHCMAVAGVFCILSHGRRRRRPVRRWRVGAFAMVAGSSSCVWVVVATMMHKRADDGCYYYLI